MENSKEVAKIPTYAEIINETDISLRQNDFQILLNQPPPENWIKKHPFVLVEDANKKKVPLDYLPIERVEYLLTRIFREWYPEVREVKLIANSVTVTVRLHIVNPVTGLWQFADGVGAAPLQTEKDKGAIAFDYIKSAAVQMALPAAKSYAVKDAAESFGKLFGKDLNRKDIIDYTTNYKPDPNDMLEEIKMLFDIKKENIQQSDIEHIERVIKNKETSSYKKILTKLKSL